MNLSDNTPIFKRLLLKNLENKKQAITEIINLKAILNLPKGTEHFVSDLHGEDEAFSHMIRNSSGAIKKSIDFEFGNTLSPKQKERLAITIYYPEDMIQKNKDRDIDLNDWYHDVLLKLIRLCRYVSSKYTRSKVRKALPEDFKYILEELLHESEHSVDKREYYDSIIMSIIDIDEADDFIIGICKVIHRLSIDRLHVVGDIFDRGDGPHRILDELMQYHSVDIQWGNHDIVWMGAALGNTACIATVIRVCARYGLLGVLEEGYGINLRSLATFADNKYADDECSCFQLKSDTGLAKYEKKLFAKMHKAISIMQFKLEGQLIKNNPSYNMQDRLLLDKIDFKTGELELDGKIYDMKDIAFPTVDPANATKLTYGEKDVMHKLKKSFIHSPKLQKHLSFLMEQGSIYSIRNSNLILHGCIPMNTDGSLSDITVFNKPISGKAAMDKYDEAVRSAYYGRKKESNNADILWYLWCGGQSPLFGKDKMTTFETYFIDDKETHNERRNSYYSFREQEQVCVCLLKEFGIDNHFSHIVNGHVPVKVKDGESPVKANGRLIVIDGGLNPAYKSVTGIAGYTLIYDSYSLDIAQHERFISKQKIIDEEKDILFYTSVCDQHENRLRVKDTDTGKMIKEEINLIQRMFIDR